MQGAGFQPVLYRYSIFKYVLYQLNAERMMAMMHKGNKMKATKGALVGGAA